MKRTISLILALLMCLCLFAGCKAEEPAAAEASAPEAETAEVAEPVVVDKNLVVGTTEAVGGLDPAGSANCIGRRLVYECLFIQDPATGEIQGQLAESWEFVDDCTLKVTLKDGVYFSNGEKLTAEDVLFTLERYVTSNSQSSSYFTVYDFESSYCEDELTFYLITFEPYGPGLSNLLNREILCKSWVEGITDEEIWWNDPVGTGPYAVQENISGSHTAYVLREDYWDTENIPEPETITVRSYAEPLTMCIDFENGDLDACFELDETDVARLQESTPDNVELVIAPTYDTYMLCLPEYIEEFDDIRVRQAIAYALDLEIISEVGMGTLAMPATSIIPNGVNYHKDIGNYPYDPEKAKELLAEAGYGAGDLSFEIVLVTNAMNQRICENIQFYLAEVGIEMIISSYDLPTAIGYFMRSETDMLLKETTEGAPDLEPNRILDTMLETSTNAAVRITDPEFVSYLNGGLNTVDTAERAEFYAKAQQWQYDNCRAIPLCDKGAAYAYHTDVLDNFQTISVDHPNLRFAKFVG